MAAKLEIHPATRRQLKVKAGLMGTAGTGKTWTALSIAEALGGKIVVIDSERGRAEAYAGDFKFDHLPLPDFRPETYIDALALANERAYDVIIVDSISHEWAGDEGILSSVDRFGGWKEATPRHDKFVDALFRLPRNVVCTMRAKTQYQVSEVPRDGGGTKQQIEKLGVGPVQRDNLEYEFDVLALLDLDHTATLHKSVISSLPSGVVLGPGDNSRALGREIAFAIKEWIEAGEEVTPPEEASDADREYLIALLREEGYDEPKIAQTFRTRRMELGALTPAYVNEQTELAIKRLNEKQVDITAIQDAHGRTEAAGTTNGEPAGSESSGDEPAAEADTEAPLDADDVKPEPKDEAAS